MKAKTTSKKFVQFQVPLDDLWRERLWRVLLLTCFVMSFVTARATYIPVALTGYNVDAICNGSGAAYTSTSGLGTASAGAGNGFDGQGYWLMDSTFNPGSGTTTVPAMPGNLQIVSSANSSVTWQLKPYSGNNALRITNVALDSMVFQMPQSAGELYILYSNVTTVSGGSVGITVNFTDGSTQVVSGNATPNWFNNIAVSGITSTVKMIGGRYNGGGSGSWENLGSSSPAGPQLYQFKVAINPANYSKPIRSVIFSNTVTGNLFYVFGITLNTVCSGSVTAGTVTSTSGTSACPGVNYTLSLPTATTGAGITYQWQSSTTGSAPWTTIANATNATYTSSQTAATTYRAYIVCNGGSADTTPAFTLTMKPANQCYCIPVSNNNSYYINSFSTTGGSTNITNSGSGPGTTSMGYSDFTVKTVTAMQSYSISFSGSSTTGSYGYAIYVDWNQNGLFTDAGEKVYTSGSSYYTSFSGSFTVPITALPGNTRMRVYCDYYSPTTAYGPCAFSSSGPYGEAEDYTFNVLALPPCSGQPVAGSIAMTSPVSACPGGAYTLTTNGTTQASNLTYQWIQYANGSTTPVPAVGPGANTPSFTPTVYDTIKYRMVITCVGSGLKDTTAPLVFNVPKPVYATLPFVEDFENWVSRCNTNEVPSFSWTNSPVTGDPSWRRNDQGATATWTSPTSGFSAPNAANGTYSARWHGYYAPVGASGAGNLDLFVNCSSSIGTKELQFYMRTYNSAYPQDTVKVFLSTDGGQTFSLLSSFGMTPTWGLQILPIVSNSATTVIRFQASDAYQYYGDIGLDYVRVLSPCTGKPSAGTVTPITPCPNVNFNLSLNNSSIAAGLTYQWQTSATGLSGSWTNIAGATQATATSNISTPTYFRCYVTCSNSSQADTTPGFLANIAAFYYCYCQNGGNPSYASYGYANIGNFTVQTQPAGVTLLNNGVASPLLNNSSAINTYTNYTNLPSTIMYKDSLYKYTLTKIEAYSSFLTGYAAVYIDFDRNGVFDPTEKVSQQTVSNSTTQAVSDTFRVPDTASFGITGMRAICQYSSSSINPCGTYSYGETEDYLADLRLPPCNGPSNAGVIISSDTAMCAGYPITLMDTSYEKTRSGLTRIWQISNNYGSTWSTVAGSMNKDTITNLFSTTSWYRLKMTCIITSDSTYSNIAKVNLKPAYKCYCYSTATGGSQDTSDIGAFSIGNFVVTTGGPHLINPAAIRGRNDYTDYGPIEIYVDSSYDVNVFHTMPNLNHGDALVTMFMDFNNNLQYDIPEERVILNDSISTINSWNMISHITIPSAAVLNVPTGMRVIMNNNVGYNVPSYTACGPYTSGETEDFVVVFRKGWPLGVGNIANLKDLSIYPNPTAGRFVISFNADKLVKDLKVRVTTVTGQTIMQEAYNNVGSSFNKEFNISEHARGIYFVEINADGEKMIRKLVVN